MKNILLFTIIIFTLCLQPVIAQDGSPDSSFGDNGVVLRPFSGFDFNISSSIELQNENILLSASTYDDSSTKFLMQIDPEGNPVSSFGIDGVLELPDGLEIFSIHKQISENEFLVFGSNTSINPNTNALFKIDSNANVILPYGDNGSLVITETNFFYTRYLVSENGALLVANYNDNNTINFTRYNEQGLLDTNFPEVTTPIVVEGSIDRLETLKISEDEKILVGFRNSNEGNISHTLYRFNESGTVDTTFNDNSYFLFPEPDYDSDSNVYSISYTPLQNGDIIISSKVSDWEGGLTETNLFKIKENGDLSSSFGNGGFVQINNYAGSVYEQPNGRLLFQGTVNDFEGGLDFNMRRYHSDGNIDSSFNFQSNYSELGAFQVLYHSNEKIYVLGSDIWYNAPPLNFVALRYNNNPLGVREFSAANILITPNPSSDVFKISYHSGLPISSTYTVYDLKGTLLIQGEFQNQTNEVDLSQFMSGVYLLKINSSILKLVKK